MPRRPTIDVEISPHRRRAELIRAGMAQAAAATASWDDDARREACSEADQALEDQVGPGWTPCRVRLLVEDLLSAWEDDDVEDGDEDEPAEDLVDDNEEEEDDLEEEDPDWEL